MQDKKADIINASLTVFQQEGLKGARMEKIAETAKVSKRTLYKHFPNKDALFMAICESVIETLFGMDMPAYNPEKPINSQLLEAVRLYIAQVTTPYFLNCSRVLMMELMRSPDFAKEFNTTLEKLDAPLGRFLADASASRQIRIDDPAFATARLLAIFKSTLYLPALFHNKSVASKTLQEEIAKECVEHFLHRFAA